MPDITTAWDSANSRGDYVFAAPVLASGNDLVTAALISLFTDRLAHTDDVLLTPDPRGWVGDLGETVLIGSRLWLLDRAKLTPQVAATAKGYAQEALQWLIDDGIVATIDIAAQVTLPNRLDMQVTLYRQDGSHVALNLPNVWNVTPSTPPSYSLPVLLLEGGGDILTESGGKIII
jgi:phage gp46-like protein